MTKAPKGHQLLISAICTCRPTPLSHFHLSHSCLVFKTRRWVGSIQKRGCGICAPICPHCPHPRPLPRTTNPTGCSTLWSEVPQLLPLLSLPAGTGRGSPRMPFFPLLPPGSTESFARSLLREAIACLGASCFSSVIKCNLLVYLPVRSQDKCREKT